ncbi:hypothetical protein SHANETTE_15 [Bacillus phage Shanette]|uniref:Uncharacterized protein n=1 Tax=Bacillus phage Shanette TaxID=1296656 RepID=S5MBE4_9CAUD|nr:hypothetical protein AVV46_gp015 [Bacillus phage Shanette]AGR47124.1 hypothetical protein SHANETTE_15 [Bacillus phage Shanette]
MIDLYNSPSKAVLNWVAGEVRNNLIKTSEWLVSKGKEPLQWSDEDIECLVMDFLNGVHEMNTVNIASRFEIEENLL